VSGKRITAVSGLVSHRKAPGSNLASWKIVWLIQAAIAVYPNAHYQGLADGAPENWSFLEPVTDTQVLDFFHATQYLDNVAKALHPRNSRHQKSWLDEHCHTLKHEVGAAERLLAEMETIVPQRVSQSVQKGLQHAITDFRNHHHQMRYAEAIACHLPIGSGVTEAACKVMVKARLCGSGMKWKEHGAGIVLSLRTQPFQGAFLDSLDSASNRAVETWGRFF
jgi:hypothetical protein